MNLQHNLTKYAELIVRVGLNVQPGDNILLRLDVNGLPLAREIAKKAYVLGVHHIHPVFSDDVLTLARYQLAEDAAFDSLPGFMTDFTEAAYQNNFHVLSLVAPNPELLKDADPNAYPEEVRSYLPIGANVANAIAQDGPFYEANATDILDQFNRWLAE